MAELDPFTTPRPTHDLGAVTPRHRVVVSGTVTGVRRPRWVGGPVTEATLHDGTGELTLVFLGRRGVAGVEPGRRLTAAGTVGRHRGDPVVLNPQLWLAAPPEREPVREPGPVLAFPLPVLQSTTAAMAATRASAPRKSIDEVTIGMP